MLVSLRVWPYLFVAEVISLGSRAIPRSRGELALNAHQRADKYLAKRQQREEREQLRLNNTSFMLTNSISAQRLLFVLYFIYDNSRAARGGGDSSAEPPMWPDRPRQTSVICSRHSASLSLRAEAEERRGRHPGSELLLLSDFSKHLPEKLLKTFYRPNNEKMKDYRIVSLWGSCNNETILVKLF